MKLYTCSHCNNLLYFENSECLICKHAVGFDAEKLSMVTLKNNQQGYSPIGIDNQVFRYCSNADFGTCNWLIPVTQSSPFCTACTLNRTIPALSNEKNNKEWKRIEIAKHGWYIPYCALGFPCNPK